MQGVTSESQTVTVDDFYVGRVFPTYRDFEELFAELNKANGTIYSKANASLVAIKNKQIKNAENHYPEDWIYYSLTLKCKHFGTVRTFSNKRRPCLNRRKSTSYKLGCESQLRLQANKQKGGLVITASVMEHTGHPTNTEFVYPEMKRLNEEEKQEMYSMLQQDLPAKQIVEHFRTKFSKPLTHQDVRNHRRKLFNMVQNGEAVLDESIWEELRQVAQTGSGDVALVNDESGNLKIVLIHSQTMKDMLCASQEVLFINSTAEILDRIPLYTFHIREAANSNHIVGYALVKDPTFATTDLVVRAFLESNNTYKPHTIMVDTEPAEIYGMGVVLPDVNIMLSYYTVYAEFQKMSSMETRKSEVLCLLRNMLRCATKKEYDQHVILLRAVASHEFVQKFEMEWNTIADSWAGCFLQSPPLTTDFSLNFAKAHQQKLSEEVQHISQQTGSKSLNSLLQVLRNIHSFNLGDLSEQKVVLPLKRQKLFPAEKENKTEKALQLNLKRKVFIESENEEDQKNETLDREERLKKTSRIIDKLMHVVCSVEDEREFNRRLDVLRQLTEMWKAGKDVAVLDLAYLGIAYRHVGEEKSQNAGL